jgi:hypothetical protein
MITCIVIYVDRAHDSPEKIENCKYGHLILLLTVFSLHCETLHQLSKLPQHATTVFLKELMFKIKLILLIKQVKTYDAHKFVRDDRSFSKISKKCGSEIKSLPLASSIQNKVK